VRWLQARASQVITVHLVGRDASPPTGSVCSLGRSLERTPSPRLTRKPLASKSRMRARARRGGQCDRESHAAAALPALLQTVIGEAEATLTRASS
jgi:hypothetical protein